MESSSPAAGSVVVDAPVANPSLDALLAPSDTFVHRHIGPNDAEIADMLTVIGGVTSLDDLIDQTVPKAIRSKKPLKAGGKPRGEHEMLVELKAMSKKNQVVRSLIGQGYYDTITPPVILRNILENPGWYTQYTPYQAEISQGRLEALLNFQTMVTDLTGLAIANASMLDEGTSAAEAMAMCRNQVTKPELSMFLIDHGCHPQTIAVVRNAGRIDGHQDGGRRRAGGGRQQLLRRARPVPDDKRPDRSLIIPASRKTCIPRAECSSRRRICSR